MRNVDSRKGLNDIKTLQSGKNRSMPRIPGSAYLELYMLQKEKDRLINENDRFLKENDRLLMKMEQTSKRIKEIDVEINKLQELENTPKVGTGTRPKKRSFTKTTKNTQNQDEEKDWKEMSLDY